MALKYFNQLLGELGNKIGIDSLSANNKGLCSLRFDDRLTIDLEYSEEKDNLLLTSLVGTIKPDQKEKKCTELLEANLLWCGTGGATLGVDPETGAVFMSYQEKLQGINFSEFQGVIKNFSDTALFWNKRLLEKTSSKKDL